MALDRQVLQQGLTDVWAPPSSSAFPETLDDAGERIAQAYVRYYASATAGPMTVLAPIAGLPVLAELCTEACDAKLPPEFAAKLVGAIVVYIVAMPYSGGAAAPPTGAPMAIASLTATFVNVFTDIDTRISQVAAILDAMTRTTLVTPVAPPNTPVPVT